MGTTIIVGVLFFALGMVVGVGLYWWFCYNICKEPDHDCILKDTTCRGMGC